MARMARVVVPDIPHHVVQRGNRNQKVFFSDDDRNEYINLIITQLQIHKTQIWAWCLMDNHVHFIAVPKDKEGLSRTFAEANRRYSRMVNFREGWRGYLWQGRFSSFPLSEKHLYAAVRYVERNPVKAGIVKKAENFPWSSARSHVNKTKDPLLTHHFLMDEISNWSEYLTEEDPHYEKTHQKHERTGRPLGDKKFISRLETVVHRPLGLKKTGPKGPWKNKNLV